jgi:hypothetical protein
MIYTLVVQDITPGKMAEFGKIVTGELLALYPRLGMKLVASWHGYTGNVNQTYTIYSFNDMAELEKVRQAQNKDADYQRVNAKLNALRTRMTRTILEPNAWSPMK